MLAQAGDRVNLEIHVRKSGLKLSTLGWLTLIVTCGCSALGGNGVYSATIAPGLHPRLSPDDAVRITRDYLNAQTPQLAAPELHSPPHVDSVIAIEAANASSLDGCIPAETSSDIVWVTKGTGDYLNLSPHPWSSETIGNVTVVDAGARECSDPGTSGTLVIDDATRSILGVFPGAPGYPRPTPYGQ